MDWKFEKNMYPILDTRVDLWSDRDTYKFLIFKVFMMNDILFMTQYAL